MNNVIANKLLISKLFYCYQTLLSTRQQDYFALYFEEDLSLQEIADQKHISKAAVHDAIHKLCIALHDLENKLQISQNQDIINKIMHDYKMSDNVDIQDIISQLKEIK